MPQPYRLRLFENYRFVLYAPFYAAHALGAYADEGLEVELLPSPGPGRAEAALAAGEVDVLWMGPIRLMKHHDDHPDSPLVGFAEVVCRDPFSLVGAWPNPDFRLAENVAALANKSLDVAQLFEPFVEEAIGKGGHVWYQASARGRTSYTVFVTHRERLDRDPEPFARMVRAMYKTQHWVAAQPPDAIAAAIAGYFPALDRDALTRALARYQGQGVWGTDPVLPEDGFNRLRRALIGSGFLKRAVPFTECVDNRLAEAAVGAGGSG